jgi:hypothetical protein
MITIMQGATKKVTVTLKSDQLVVQDPADAKNIMLQLHHENSNKVLVTFGTNETIMDASGVEYSTALIDGNYIDFYVEARHTLLFPPGRIIGTFTITYEDQYFEGDRVIKARGAMFNIIM